MRTDEKMAPELSFSRTSASFAKVKRKKWLAKPKETLSVNGTAIYINNLQPEVHLMGPPWPADGPHRFKSCSVVVLPPSSANAITCDARTGNPPGVDWKETKRQLLSPVKSRSSLHEPVGAPWAGNGGQSCAKGAKMRFELSCFTSSVGFAKEKRKKWLAITRRYLYF